MNKVAKVADNSLELAVVRAREGDRAALDYVVGSINGEIYRLAARFLWHPADAEDAAQEILIRVITGLSSFRGDSRFRTWVYRIACNALLSMRQQRMESRAMSFEQFGADLNQGLTDDFVAQEPGPEAAMLMEEVKIGCTLAVLLCLDRDHRLAYILGEIMELDHNEASAVLEIEPAKYRKRLSRARADIEALMTSRCGLINSTNHCRCRRRVRTAVATGRVDPLKLLFASSQEQVARFPIVLREIRELEEGRRTAALYRSHPEPNAPATLTSWIRNFLVERPEVMD